jgi:alpha-galactosidase
VAAPPKIALIGAGSASFALGVLRDLYRTPDVAGGELALVDIDPTALARTEAVARRLEAETSRGFRISATTDRRDALPGADFVILSIAVNRFPLWEQDYLEPLRLGFHHCYGENAGPGAVFHTLRNLPIVIAIARDMEELCPRAWLLTFTNPENRVCLALHRHSAIRTVGLCHGVNGTLDMLAGHLSLPRADLDAQVAGVNHLVWMLRFTRKSTGEDLFPLLAQAVASHGPPAGYDMCCRLWDALDCFPTTGDSHVGEFLSFGAEFYTGGFNLRGFQGGAQAAAEQAESLARAEAPLSEWLSRGSAEIATEVIRCLHLRTTERLLSVIVPNRGAVPNLPADSVVETAGMFADGDVRAEPTDPIPPAAASITRRELDIQELVVEAWARSSRKAALQALLLDPCVDSLGRAELLLDRMLELQRDYLPPLG